MSTEQEAIVRQFIEECGFEVTSLPYDWLDMDDIEFLDSAFAPIPDEVLEAYNATRSNPEDRERDLPSYVDNYEWTGTPRAGLETMASVALSVARH